MAQGSQNLPYVFLGGVIIVAIVVVTTIILPQYQAAQGLRTEAEDTRMRRVERQAFLDAFDNKAQQLRSQAIHEKELGVVLPATNAIDDVLRIVDRLSAEAGVVVASVTNVSSSVQSNLNSAQARGHATSLPESIVPLGVNVSFTGSYQQARQFIDGLSQSARLIDVQNIRMAAGSEGGEILGVDIVIHFYSYAP